MRFATSRSRNHFAGLVAVALLTVAIAACGSSNNAKPDTGVTPDASGKSDAAGDARADVRVDAVRDTTPPPQDVQNPLCQGISPTTDFSDPYVIADFDMGNDQTFAQFGSGTVSGGTYPAVGTGYPFTDVSGFNWHISGTVGPTDDAHFGIYWLCTLSNASGGCLLDVSRFKGISFKIKGNAGPDNQMTLSLGRAENDTNAQNAMCGSCVVPASSDASAGDYCRGPRTTFTVPADCSETTVTLLWTDFHGGSPHDSLDPHQVTGILWVFHDPAAPDGGTGNDGGTDAPADAPMSTGDGSASDAGMCSDDGGVCEAGAPGPGSGGTGSDDGGADDASSGPGYNADITIDDITLVPF